jgi:hypothetical protein
MKPIVVELLRGLLTLGMARKIAVAWLVSFAAASASVMARRFHKEGRRP